MRPKAPPVLGQDWLTTPAVSPDDLVGRVSLLAFWSAGCEASLARLVDLQSLTRRLPPTLSVVAVHTPRFAYEQDSSAVSDIIARSGLDLIVVHDPQLLTWARYSPGGWPATVLIDHRGRAVGASLGLDDLAPLEEAARFALLKAERRLQRVADRIDKGPSRRTDRARKRLPVALPAPVAPTPKSNEHGLAWPSGVCVVNNPDTQPARLAIVDSGNNRVLIVELANDARSGDVVLSLEGLDGASRVCALDSGSVAVSLPTSGKVVAIDLEDAAAPATILATDLKRPQGMSLDKDGSLVVADAGDNQLLRITPDGVVGVIAGRFLADGISSSSDGPAARAELNQPVDVVRTSHGLAFLDAASSNLRLLDDKGTVRTVTSNDFQCFGLVDGPAHRASLQRPSAAAVLPDGSLAIADTGNHRIRTLSGRRLTTLGLAGLRLPEDLTALADGRLVVADTGNHRLLVVDVHHEEAWELDLHGLPPVGSKVADSTSPLAGVVNSRVIADVPYAGEGPWTVRVRSEPEDLVEAIKLIRHEEHPVSVALAAPGHGELHIESEGTHPTDRTWWRRPLSVESRD